MAENGISMDQNPGRWLVLAIGGVLCEAGVQSMLTSQVTRFSIEVGITVVGVLLILLALFWNKLKLQETTFFEKLNRLASHPSLWIFLVVLFWIFTQTLNAIKEIRINNEIVALRNDEQSMANVINRTIIPRRLSKQQKVAISGFLRQFSPHEFAFQLAAINDSEEGDFRSDIEEALTRGGWTISKDNPYDYTKTNLPEGLSVVLSQTQNSSQKQEDPTDPKPDKLFMMAMGTAGVRLSSMGAGSGGAITSDRFIIIVGKRRVDAYALAVPDALY